MDHRPNRRSIRAGIALLALLLVASACGTSSDTAEDGVGQTDTETATASSDESEAATETATSEESGDSLGSEQTPSDDHGAASTFTVEVWADNWMAVHVEGELIGEDSVAITTERSFNAETFTFEATYPFAIGIEAKDFKETDSGIEYIGEPNQQMGDGGLIAQITDMSSGDVVAVTGSEWSVQVVHRAPLNTDCVDDPDPDATCEYEIIETPLGWADPGFDDSDWPAATEWNSAEVDPKGGYDEIAWDPAARFIWGSDLEVDNTILARVTVEPE